ncbi:roadblock/LC7 domain-containing protein [Kitasatospora sp. NPDC057692]|uniref:roadblock/LC7 domain-containing protein n=1 Tax=Kitasatospora sp. NPDC057692 TaxID=3346215 RepID=UPI0036C713A2
MRRTLKQRAGRRQLIALETELLTELRALRHRLPHLAGGLVASVDGLLVAHDTHGTEPSGLAAMSAASLSLAHRLADSTGQGEFRESLVRGENGYVATYAAGGSCVLTLLAHPEANIGRLHLEARRSAQRIAALVNDPVPPVETRES